MGSKNKSKQQFLGGSKECEFFCTYYYFEKIIVHSHENLNAKEIEEDYPINLRNKEEVAKFQDKLPHHRFLLNDKGIFDLTVQILISWIKLMTNASGEKEKMKMNLKTILEDFLNVTNYEQLY
jgi:hypothetical protein